MEISKSSWHYRLYRFICNIPKGPRYLLPFTKVERRDVPVPPSLCPYFWSIFLGVIGAIVIGIGLSIAAIVAAPFVGIWWVFVRALRILRAADRAIMGRLPARRRREREPKEKRDKNPSLVVAFAKASKNRVCPTIKLVD